MLSELEIAEINGRYESALALIENAFTFGKIEHYVYSALLDSNEDIRKLISDRDELVAEAKQRERLESARDIWKRRAQALERQNERVKNQREEIGRLHAENAALKKAILLHTGRCATCKHSITMEDTPCYECGWSELTPNDWGRYEFDMDRYKDGGDGE